MPTVDAMTIDERRKYLKRMLPRYRGADRAGRGALLTEMEAVTGLHRKSLTRLLNASSLERHRRVRQRGRTYGPAVREVVGIVWESLDYVCAERLTPALLPTARHLAQISCSTVQRLLGRLPRQTPRLPHRGPEAAKAVRAAVPMKRLPWSLAQPGHVEVDLGPARRRQQRR